MPQRSVVEAPNPLREGLRIKHSPEPCVMVMFGATGDLTHRKLLPALYNLALEHPLPAGFSVVGFARRPYSDEQFREQALESINQYSRQKPVNPQVWESFASGICYLQADFHDLKGYEKLNTVLEGRGAYYEESGAIRDMLQNHVLQLLSLVAMEPPIAFDADAVRDEKVKVLHALQPLTGHEVETNLIRAQYGTGWVGGKQVVGYREEPGVSPRSITPTYIALKVFIDSWRWAGVPFYLRTA